MALTIAKLGKALAVHLRSVAANGDWRQAALGLADAIDPLPTPKPVPVPTPTPTPVNVLPVGMSDASLKLVWSDEFDGAWPDINDWRQGEKNKADGNMLPPGFPVNDANAQKTFEKQLYANGQVVEASSCLTLTAARRTIKISQVAESDVRKGTITRNAGTDADPDIYYWPYWSGTLLYESGWASTGPDNYGIVDKSWVAQPSRHEWLYGVFECRVKLPKGKGFWPAVWMLRSDGKTRDEIDLFEMVDPTGQHIAMHYHCDAVPDWTNEQGIGHNAGVDLTQDFHTVSVDWTKDYIRWYLDGKLIQEFADKPNICSSPMYIIANLAVGGSWPGDPDSSTAFPQSMLIDYIRVWQRT